VSIESLRIESNSILCGISTAVIGCINPATQPGMKMTRNGDVITISCDVTTGDITSSGDSVWQMTCVRNQWIGSHGNCSAGMCVIIELSRLLHQQQ